MRRLLLLALVGCYSPKVHPGAPCGPQGQCPDDLTCSAAGTCDPIGGGGGDTSPIDAPLVDAIDASPALDACTTCTPPANDLPGGAIDVTAGGDFTADLTYANDDASKPTMGGTGACGNDGGLDVFYKVHLTKSEVYYFDTFASAADLDTVIRVFHGPCVGGAAPSTTVCHDNALCGTSVHTQWVGTLTAGDSCIVVDGKDGTQTGHALELHAERGHRDGIAIAANPIKTPSGSYAVTGDTSQATNVADGSCINADAPDIGYYFIQCPGQQLNVTASTCNAATAATPWDTALYADGPGAELACEDDDSSACVPGGGLSTISFATNGPHLYWVVIDGGGGNPSAGAYELDFTFP